MSDVTVTSATTMVEIEPQAVAVEVETNVSVVEVEAQGATTVQATVQEAPVIIEVSGQGPAGHGVPPGGTPGQVLKKKSGTHFDTEWGDVDAAQVTYEGNPLSDVLDGLLYVPPEITSFSLSLSTVEIGSTVTAVDATWTYNKAMAAATLTDATIDPDDRSYAFTGLNLTSSKTYTLTCEDAEAGTDSASRTVTFTHKRYWGAITTTDPDDATLIALSKEFSTSKAKSITFDCTGGRYPCFAYVATAGDPTSITVGGFAFSDYTVTTRTFVNASGHSASFKIIVFNGLQTGAAISVVFA